MRLGNMAFVLVAGIVAGGLATSLALRPAPGLNEAEVRAIVDSAIAASADKDIGKAMSSAAIDPATLHPMIESYLMSDPKILQRMSVALQTELQTEKIAKTKTAIADMHDQIYNDPDQVVLGNPDGDVTLVEMFDYNCSFCRGALPDLAALLDSDPKLKVILKEFPILSKESADAARIAVIVNRRKADYWAFHEALFTSRGQVNEAAALDAAEKLGLSRIDVQLDASAQDVTDAIQRSYDIAKALNVSGTPTYIIGDEIIPGAIGLDDLKQRIANIRACGSTVCQG